MWRDITLKLQMRDPRADEKMFAEIQNFINQLYGAELERAF